VLPTRRTEARKDANIEAACRAMLESESCSLAAARRPKPVAVSRRPLTFA
jgi:hypothetical protein